MSDDANKYRDEMDEEFAQFRKHLGSILEAVDAVDKAGPTDDVSGLLERLEDTVHHVRTGGLLAGGAKGHRDARDKWMKARGMT